MVCCTLFPHFTPSRYYITGTLEPTKISLREIPYPLFNANTHLFSRGSTECMMRRTSFAHLLAVDVPVQLRGSPPAGESTVGPQHLAGGPLESTHIQPRGPRRHICRERHRLMGTARVVVGRLTHSTRGEQRERRRNFFVHVRFLWITV